MTYCHFCLLKLTKYLKICPSGWISPTPMNICFWYLTHAFTTIVPWILLNYVRIKFIMADLSPFLFAPIDKIFENFVCPDVYLLPWMLFGCMFFFLLNFSSFFLAKHFIWRKNFIWQTSFGEVYLTNFIWRNFVWRNFIWCRLR